MRRKCCCAGHAAAAGSCRPCLQRGESQLFSASSAAWVLPGSHLNLACELPAESFYDLGLWYTKSPRIKYLLPCFISDTYYNKHKLLTLLFWTKIWRVPTRKSLPVTKIIICILKMTKQCPWKPMKTDTSVMVKPKKINAQVLYKCVTVNTKQFSLNATRESTRALN